MATVTLILKDSGPDNLVSVGSKFDPAIGHPVTKAQIAALDIMLYAAKQWGVAVAPPAWLSEKVVEGKS